MILLLLFACAPAVDTAPLETGDTCGVTVEEFLYAYNERFCEWSRVCRLQQGFSEEDAQSEYDECVSTPPTDVCYEPCGEASDACLDAWDYTRECTEPTDVFEGIPVVCGQVEHCD